MNDFIIVTGHIVGKSRPRMNRETGAVYTPKQTKQYEELVRWCYKTQGGEYFHDQPVEVTIIAEYAVPKGTSMLKATAMLAGNIKPTKKPDIDNIEKIVLDALNGVAYLDDLLVVHTKCYKFYADKSRLMIKVERARTALGQGINGG